MFIGFVLSCMNHKSKVRFVWNSYWFRLLITAVPFGIIVGVVSWISAFIGVGNMVQFSLLFAILLSYAVFEENYLKSWRRENTKLDN